MLNYNIIIHYTRIYYTMIWYDIRETDRGGVHPESRPHAVLSSFQHRIAVMSHGRFSKLNLWKWAQPSGASIFRRAFRGQDKPWFRDSSPSPFGLLHSGPEPTVLARSRPRRRRRMPLIYYTVTNYDMIFHSILQHYYYYIIVYSILFYYILFYYITL